MANATAQAPSAPDADALRLAELGYPQRLRRRLRLVDSVAIGFATISPVVGLYAVAAVGMAVAGPAWIWALPVALAGQALLVALYAELAAELPIANGLYQWTRRLASPGYGWFVGWVTVCAYLAANTTIAYLAAPWALTLVGVEATPSAIVLTAALIVCLCSAINAWGIDALRHAARAGAVVEIVVAVGIVVVLGLALREHPPSLLTSTLGAEAAVGGSTLAALLAALAVAGWAFLGFDAVVATGEETRQAGRRLPRAVWLALLSVGLLIVVDAVAVTLAHPDPGAVVAGSDVDPVMTAITGGLGDGAARPFAAVTLLAFLTCGVTAQGATARILFSAARDDALPASRLLRSVDRRGVPLGALVVVTVVAICGLLLGLESAAIGSVIAFGTAAFYVAFLLLAAGVLWARIDGTWRPAGGVAGGRRRLVVNVLAVLWLAFEAVNIAWPRAVLAPAGAPWHQVWSAPLLLAVITVAGVAYWAVARPPLPR